MDKIHIAIAQYTDLTALIALEQQCFSQDLLYRRHYQRFLKTNSTQILVAKKNQQIIGHAIILFRKNSKKARLYSLAIHPNYRGRGIATQLVLAAEEHAGARNCHSMLLEVREDNLKAIKLYQKLGYKPFGIYANFYEDKSHALRFKKELCQ